MRKKTAKQYLEAQGFEEVKDLPRRGRNLMDAEEIKTLAINSSGRVSIPINVLKHYDLECTYFNISFNSKKQAAIVFHNDKNTPGCKKIIRFEDKKTGKITTAYVAIGPQLRALGYSWKPSKLRFTSEAKRLIVINLKDLMAL